MNRERYLVCGYVRGAGLQVPVCKDRCKTQDEAIQLAEKWMEQYTVQVVDTLFMEEFLELREKSMAWPGSSRSKFSGPKLVEGGVLQ